MICSKCGFENAEDMQFCGMCGAGLQPSQPEPVKPTFTHESERKVVTALFSDLTGYTSLTERLDPEQVKEITGKIFAGVKEIIAKYEGFIDRLLGDGVLAFFGIPKSHEDDPIRALQAALEIHEFVKGLSPQYEGRIGVTLSMHSGVNTGLVVTAEVDLEKGSQGVSLCPMDLFQNPGSLLFDLIVHGIRGQINFPGPSNRAVFNVGLGEYCRIAKQGKTPGLVTQYYTGEIDFSSSSVYKLYGKAIIR